MGGREGGKASVQELILPELIRRLRINVYYMRILCHLMWGGGRDPFCSSSQNCPEQGTCVPIF